MIRNALVALSLLVVLADCKAKLGGACNAEGQCETGLTCCNLVCVNAQSDLNNCGGCFQVCGTQHSGALCTAGVCHLACTAGYGDCNGQSGDGCEEDLSVSATHCGSCANACTYSNASGVCRDSACFLGTCAEHFDDCDKRGPTGCETDLRTSAENCGACGNKCVVPNAKASCVASSCGVASCNTGFGNCDHQPDNGCEVDLLSNAAHCNNCETPCTAGLDCVNGTCISRELLIIGGFTDATQTVATSEIWRFNEGTKLFSPVQPSGTGPGEITLFASAWDGPGNRAIIATGSLPSGATNLQTWALSFATTPASWVDLAPNGVAPSGRSTAASAWDSAQRQLYVFGGFDITAMAPLNDVWVYDAVGNTWSTLAAVGAIPPERTFASATFDSDTGHLFVTGGFDSARVPFDDLFILDTRANPPVWTNATPSPAVTGLFGGTFFPSTTPRLFYGGVNFTAGQATTQLRTLNLSTHAWATLLPMGATAPAARFLHYAITQGTNRFIYGGLTPRNGSNTPNRDLWKYDSVANTWELMRAGTTTPGPLSVFGGAMVPLD